jgi:hypothetical protein
MVLCTTGWLRDPLQALAARMRRTLRDMRRVSYCKCTCIQLAPQTILTASQLSPATCPGDCEGPRTWHTLRTGLRRLCSVLELSKRDATALKAIMRRVKDLNVPFLAAKKRVDLINNKIDDNLEKLTFEPYHSLCVRVRTSLPRELRDNIYRYLYSCNVRGRSGIRLTMDLLLLRAWVKRSPGASPLSMMRLWLGNQFTHELIEHCYRNSTFSFGADFGNVSLWLPNDIWSSDILPGILIKHFEFTLGENTLTDCLLEQIAYDSESVTEAVKELALGEHQLPLPNSNAALTITIFITHDLKDEKWILALRKLIIPLQPAQNDWPDGSAS